MVIFGHARCAHRAENMLEVVWANGWLVVVAGHKQKYLKCTNSSSEGVKGGGKVHQGIREENKEKEGRKKGRYMCGKKLYIVVGDDPLSEGSELSFSELSEYMSSLSASHVTFHPGRMSSRSLCILAIAKKKCKIISPQFAPRVNPWDQGDVLMLTPVI